MPHLYAIASGAVIGLSVTAPVGPMAVLCINRTLRSGIEAGISTGAGASTVQVAYTALILLGLQHAGPMLTANRALMGLASAALMLLFAWRILQHRPRRRRGAGGGSVVRNYLSALAFNGVNPMLLVLLVGAVGAIVGPEPPLGPAISALLVGVFIGSFGWWIALSLTAAALRGRLGPEVLHGINRLAAAGMVGFAVLSLVRVFGE